MNDEWNGVEGGANRSLRLGWRHIPLHHPQIIFFGDRDDFVGDIGAAGD